MSIENTLTELIAALTANTEALTLVGAATTRHATNAAASSAAAAASSAAAGASAERAVNAAPAPTTRAPRGSKTAPAAEPAKEATPEPAATPAATPAAKGPTVNDLKKYVKSERDRLAEVSPEAVKKHKEESAKVLKKYGLVDFTSIPEDKVEAMLADFKAINVEQPKDDLEDDDSDGL